MPRAKLPLLVLTPLALGAGLVLVGLAQSYVAEAGVKAAVAALLQVTAPLVPVAAVDEAPLPAEPELDAPAAVAGISAPSKGQKARPAAARAAKPSAVFVGASRVLSLSRSTAQPRGSFVPQTPDHPAGLRLYGVAALGIGVHDGDILVEAMGSTPRSSGQVIGAIIQARAERVRYLSGTLWRNGQTYRITVEQPYVDPA